MPAEVAPSAPIEEKAPAVPADKPIRYLDRQRLIAAWQTALGYGDGKRKKPSNDKIVATSYAVIGMAWSGQDLNLPTLRDLDYDVIEYGERAADAIGEQFTTAEIVKQASAIVQAFSAQATETRAFS